MAMNKSKITSKTNKLEFNTYCIFSEEKRKVSDIIGLMFKDYIENLKSNKCN